MSVLIASVNKRLVPAATRPSTFLVTETVVGFCITGLGCAYIIHRISPDIVSLESFLIISALLILLMSAVGLWLEVVRFRWKLIFTAKTFFLGGCVGFLAGGITSSLISNSYANYPQRDVIITAAYFVGGTACFLLSYEMTSGKKQKLSLRSARPLRRLSSIQLWVGSAGLLAAGLLGVHEQQRYQSLDVALRPVWNLAGNCLVPAAVLLALIIVRKQTSPLQRIIAFLSVCPVIYILSNTWSRRPLQTVLVAACVIYVADRKFTRNAQLALCLAAFVLGLSASAVQNWYRQANRQHLNLQLAQTGAYINHMASSVAEGKLFDTLDTATETTVLYPARYDYLYGKSFVALLVNPIPRRFWPGKPMGFAYTLGQEVYRMNIPPSNLGPSIEGELYANGGLVAVVLGMLAIGTMCGKYDSMLLGATRNESAILIYAIGLYQFLFLVRGDFLDAGYWLIVSVVPVLVVIHLLGHSHITKLTRHRTHAV